ncbi:GNAT family N-acetyltransferase [Paenibacillus macerans]|uniref:GNAT family N-acetyltransferase n=1 Tax=Paenibacillus macerans TaxID=44252 RepID=UPI003D319C71
MIDIEATVDPCNARSRRLLDKLHFERADELKEGLCYYVLKKEDVSLKPSLIVQETGLEHLEVLAGLFNEYRVFYEQESDLEGARRFLADRLSRRESVAFLALDAASREAVGFTQLYPSFSSVSMRRIWILNDLYVREEYRKQGAAKLLLEAAKSHARQTNAKGLELSTAVANMTAQRLYERHGYAKDEDFYHYYLSL